MEQIKEFKNDNSIQLETNLVFRATNVLSIILIIAYAVSLSLPITIPWTILILGIAVMILNFAARVAGPSILNPKDILAAPLTLPIIVFVLAVFISGLTNGGMVEALRSAQGLRGMLVYLWAYWAFYANPKLKKLAVKAIIISGAIAGLSAAVEQLTGYHPFSFPYLQGTGFLSGPMAFSGLAQLFSMLALGIFLKDGYIELGAWLSNRYIFSVVLLGNFLGLVFCSERSAWLGAIIAIIATLFLVSFRKALLTNVILFITTALSWLVLPVVRQRLSNLSNWQADVSITTRITLWQRAWYVFKKSPIFGVGIRHFPHLHIQEALQQGHVALDHAHSNYFHILATTGLIGICAYIYLWFSALKLSYFEQKNSNYSKIEQGIYLGVFAGIVSLAVSGLFEYNFGTGQVRLAQWFLLAMLIRPAKAAS